MDISQITPQHFYAIMFLVMLAGLTVIGLLWAWLEDRDTPTARRKRALKKSLKALKRRRKARQ
jgi:predicted MFS family arabinose efflux permease